MMFAAAGCWTLSGPAIAQETGTIVGQIADEQGHTTRVGDAAVFLMDAASGLPILKSTRKPFEPARVFGRQRDDKPTTDFWYAEAGKDSYFEFPDVPPGRYRLIAQGWSGTKGVPLTSSDSNPSFMLKDPSATLVLHGVAENVEVKAGERIVTWPRALGRGILRILNDPEEDHAFLLISLKPRLGPGILGPAAWGPEFLKGLIGYTQMETPYVTLVGLPDDTDIHVGLFNYDNNPGVGGDTFRVQDHYTEVRLEVFASWSNGKSEPPAELLPLTDYLDKNSLTVESVLGLTGNRDEIRNETYRLLREEPDRKVQIGDLGEFRIADILAASAHRDLRKYHRERKNK
ncbi:MAG: hypothetical protein U0361_25035 [Nitrospiraceae bacterium]